MYISSNGGLLDGDGKLIPKVNFPEDFDRLLSQEWCKHGTRLKVMDLTKREMHSSQLTLYQ